MSVELPEVSVRIAPTAGTAWWPSRYGEDDEAGALNQIGPDQVLDAVRLVRRGRVFDLAHVLHADIPAFPGRTFRSVPHHQRAPRQPAPPGRGRAPDTSSQPTWTPSGDGTSTAARAGSRTTRPVIITQARTDAGGTIRVDRDEQRVAVAKKAAAASPPRIATDRQNPAAGQGFPL